MNHNNEIVNNAILRCKQNFLKNLFNFIIVDNLHEAKETVIKKIIPELGIKSASWGDSLTLMETGILEILENKEGINFIQTFDDLTPREEIIERRKKALTVDLFLTGSNAITEQGQIINLDCIGNRIAPIIFGPKHVIIIAGKNKIVPDIPAAMNRIKNYAAPLNAKRHNYRTPCVLTGKCMDCQDKDRICNAWSIIEKSRPPGRINIILIKKDLGL
jgi:L-lactate utilization protein LutC